MKIRKTSWSSHEKYDEFMGKWSLMVAKKFLDWLAIEASIERKKWLDVGCGTGALTYEIARRTNPEHILGIDPSDQYLPKGINHNNFQIVDFIVGFAHELPAKNSNYDIVVSALALNFMDNKENCIKEMLRTIKPNGIIALYVWDYARKMEFLRYFWDAVIKNNQHAIKYDEGELFPICNPESLKDLFTACEVKNIKIEELEIKTTFSSFDQYWAPFLGGQGPAGNYLQIVDDKEKTEIRELLQNTLPISEDGSIQLIARAFAIKGTK